MPGEHEPTPESTEAKPGDAPSNEVAPTSQSIPEESSIEVDPEWTEGDFTIVSSDGVAFRIPSYYLYAASSVLRDAERLSSSSSKSFQFTDNSIETQYEIRLFLQVLTGQELKPQITKKSHFYDFIRFAKKWDCRLVVHSVLFQVSQWVRTNDVAPLRMWVCGVLAEDMSTCLAALDKYGKSWEPASHNDDSDITQHMSGTSTFDPYGWGVSFWEHELPFEYSCALARAFGYAGPTSRLGPTFKKYLDKYFEKRAAKDPEE